MKCNRNIPSVVNNLKNIFLNSYLFNEFSTKYYSGSSAIFEYLLRIFVKPLITNIGHPAFPEE